MVTNTRQFTFARARHVMVRRPTRFTTVLHKQNTRFKTYIQLHLFTIKNKRQKLNNNLTSKHTAFYRPSLSWEKNQAAYTACVKGD